MTDEEIIDGIRRPGRFDAEAGTAEDAERLVRTALPHAVELPPAESGSPYPPPPPGTDAWFQRHPDERREGDLKRAVEALGGRLDYREDAAAPGGAIVLTFEFDDRERAEAAARALRARGEHVEGPQDYAA